MPVRVAPRRVHDDRVAGPARARGRIARSAESRASRGRDRKTACSAGRRTPEIGVEREERVRDFLSVIVDEMDEIAPVSRDIGAENSRYIRSRFSGTVSPSAARERRLGVRGVRCAVTAPAARKLRSGAGSCRGIERHHVAAPVIERNTSAELERRGGRRVAPGDRRRVVTRHRHAQQRVHTGRPQIGVARAGSSARRRDPVTRTSAGVEPVGGTIETDQRSGGLAAAAASVAMRRAPPADSTNSLRQRDRLQVHAPSGLRDDDRVRRVQQVQLATLAIDAIVSAGDAGRAGDRVRDGRLRGRTASVGIFMTPRLVLAISRYSLPSFL